MKVTAWQRAEVMEGLFHFPTEENRDAQHSCATCAHGDPVRPMGKSDHRKRVRCAKLAASLKDSGFNGKTATIPAATVGCHYWAKR